MEVSSANRPGVLYEVQKITGMSVGTGNVRTYQVQWAPAWVSGLHLVGCEHLIEEFLQKQDLDESSGSRRISNDEFDNASRASDFGAPHRNDNASNVPAIDQNQSTNKNLISTKHTPKDSSTDSIVLNTDDTLEIGQKLCTQNDTTYISVKIEGEGKCISTDEEAGGSGLSRCTKTFEYTVKTDTTMNDDYDMKGEDMTQPAIDYHDAYEDQSLQYIADDDSDVESEENMSTINEKKLDSMAHLWVRPSPGKYQCLPCSKIMRSKSELRRHLRTHTGERPFKCEICSKSFSWKECLTSHLKVHAGQRYTCTHCQKTFSDKSNLSRHMKRFCKGPVT